MAENHCETPVDDALAQRLGVSREAAAAVRQCNSLDLHIDTFIPMRLWGYDIHRAHGPGLLRGRLAGHLDLPRIEAAGLGGAMWSVTTNPARSRRGRWRAVRKNFGRLRVALAAAGEKTSVVGSLGEYRAARARGAHAVMLAIQGGNALDAATEGAFLPDPALLRVTLVHLTNSLVGQSSQPWQASRQRGLSAHGAELIARLNRHRVFVDLAHISKQGFWQALAVHDKTQPALVTHTGVEGVTPHWRNLDDEQIRAIAERGGVIGVMFHAPFLRRRGPRDASMIVDHMQHIIEVVGEDFVSIGSDYDGAILPPRDLRSGDSYARLVQVMLDRRWSTTRIEKILGDNFLRALAALRP